MVSRFLASSKDPSIAEKRGEHIDPQRFCIGGAIESNGVVDRFRY
jgi:hypothetical protein